MGCVLVGWLTFPGLFWIDNLANVSIAFVSFGSAVVAVPCELFLSLQIVI